MGHGAVLQRYLGPHPMVSEEMPCRKKCGKKCQNTIEEMSEEMPTRKPKRASGKDLTVRRKLILGFIFLDTFQLCLKDGCFT